MNVPAITRLPVESNATSPASPSTNSRSPAAVSTTVPIAVPDTAIRPLQSTAMLSRPSPHCRSARANTTLPRASSLATNTSMLPSGFITPSPTLIGAVNDPAMNALPCRSVATTEPNGSVSSTSPDGDSLVTPLARPSRGAMVANSTLPAASTAMSLR